MKEMFHGLVLLCSCCWSINGVFGDSVSVAEGDSVTLHTALTELHEDDDILWTFGAEKTLIAKIKKKKQISLTNNDGPEERFRARLKLDLHTGDLTITSIRPGDEGQYELDISGEKKSSKTFSVSVDALLPVPVISSNSSDCSSSSSSSSWCPLVCSVENVSHVTLSWFRGNRSLSSISASDLSISLSLPLEVEHQDKNTYSCEIRNPIRNHTTRLEDIRTLCEPCGDQDSAPLTPTVLIAAAAGSFITVALISMFCICRKRQKTVQNQEKDQTDSPSSCEPIKRKKKSKEPVYGNITKTAVKK